MAAVLLALVTACCWGVANYLTPLLARRHPMGAVLLVGHGVAVLGAGLLVLVAGGTPPDARALALGAGAGACNALAAACVYTAAAAGPLSVVMPINATGSAVPVALALASGERPGVLQLVGIPLAVAGTVLVAARDAGAATPAAPRTIVLALVSALAFGGFLVLLSAASEQSTTWGLLTTRSVALLLTVPVLLALSVPCRVPARALPGLSLPGVLLVVGTVSYAVASLEGLVSVVAVLATLFPVLTVTLAVVLLGERLARRQQAGFAGVMLGVVLLGAG